MTKRRKHLTFAHAAALLAVFCCVGCSGDGESSAEPKDEEGLALCCELGALCHVVGDDASAEVIECHELGHANDPQVCRDEYDRCVTACADENDEPLQHDCE